MTDELEERLRAADPAPPTVPVDPARSLRARTLVEHIMDDASISTDLASPARRRGPLLAAAAAMVAVVAVAGAVALGGDDPEPTTPLALTVASEDPLAMCIEVTPDTLRASGIELAFKGTVTEVDRDQATLEVEQWYLGGDRDTVTLTGATGGDAALLGGVALEAGGDYLVSASEGTVRSCGQSGVASAELEAIYAEAFAG